jgi:hypothetical protein
MRLSQRVTFAIGGMLTLQLLQSAAAIGLLSRMGPAIDAILTKNEAAVGSVEDMLSVLAEAEGGPAAADDRAVYSAALARLDVMVVENPERPAIDRLKLDSPAALEGDRAARVRVLAALERLGDRNLRAMRAEDFDARQLGVAGTWAAAAIGLISFGAGVIIRRRLAADLDEPIIEVDAALSAVGGGDPHRRAAVRADVPAELVRIAMGVNDLLDRRESPGTQRALRIGTADRALLLHLVDAEAAAIAAVDPRGEIILANQAANDLFAGDQGPRHRAALHNVPSGGRPENWEITRVGPVWMCKRTKVDPGYRTPAPAKPVERPT